MTGRWSKKNYEIQKGPPAPDFDRYLGLAKAEWKKLLVSDPTEKAVQGFLERNPMFVPGGLTPGTRSGHAPHLTSLITQPKLPGLAAKIPDFLWISTHSTHWYPTLIEIERPSKRLFTKKGTPTAQFTEARNQLAGWRAWFSDPENVQQFATEYGVPDFMKRGRQMRLHMILIYGRRSEVDRNPKLEKLRGSLLNGSDEELMSFDRVGPELDLRDAITLTARGNGMYRAKYIPPIFRYCPMDADKFRYIDGVVECLERNAKIPVDRRKFLISRFPYWKEKAQRNSFGFVSCGDEE